ncbi:hypothetical protein ABEV00_07025 [Paenibacillus thiaminolyticus]|uniref:hypothetical protein n=1 Tax=Paenibacillus thiaminolyticus TaxID=49283 RepID=UPI003D2B28E9
MYVEVIKTNRNVLLYLLGAGTSNLGNVILGLAFLFLAYELTESSIYTTGVAISQVVPYLFFGLIGGVIADWVNKKRLSLWLPDLKKTVLFQLETLCSPKLIVYVHHVD